MKDEEKEDNMKQECIVIAEPMVYSAVVFIDPNWHGKIKGLKSRGLVAFAEKVSHLAHLKGSGSDLFVNAQLGAVFLY